MTRIIPATLLDNHELELKALVLLFTLLVAMVMSLLLIPVLIYSFEESPAVRDGGLQVVSICITIYIVSFILLNRFALINMAGNLTMASIYFSTVISIWSTGGIYSPIVFVLIIPAVYAFVITNMLSAYIWSTITILSYCAIWGVDELAIRYEAMASFESMQVIINSADFSMLNLIAPILASCGILLVVAIYERNSRRMKKMLAEERNMFAFKASHDPLTGLANRAEFDLRIRTSIKTAWHSSYPLALVYIDLDGFKPINDTVGHHAGDVVLQEVARRLLKVVRGTDVVARLGGDEFALILQGVGSNAEVEPLLKKVLSNIAEDITLEDGSTVNVRGSLGVAYYPDDAETEDKLCRYADMAMYLAKEEKNTWRYYRQVA